MPLPPGAGDQATVSVFVAVPVARAFEVFTREIDAWWRRGPRYRMAGRMPGTLVFEPGLGGRLFESFATPEGERMLERGRIAVWEPPTRLVFRWRVADATLEESTEVEVLFEPVGAGTRVTVCHRGWAAIRPDHPARHGLTGTAFSRMIGLWWGDLASALREFIAGRG
ncbi:MAG TPA: SRPBCC domain-containing protein [Steroidobacteraceae bacterium]|nr:SRPBCC domain-containing protein [Steroidobacteraceae bacterium]